MEMQEDLGFDTHLGILYVLTVVTTFRPVTGFQKTCVCTYAIMRQRQPVSLELRTWLGQTNVMRHPGHCDVLSSPTPC